MNPLPLLKLYLIPTLIVLSSCQHSPLQRWQDHPELRFEIIEGQGFLHQLVMNHPANSGALAPQQVLHVYLEGDGRPWWTRYEVALDPTPKQLPMLELMASDKNAALYLGRPCYFSLQDSACNPIWWTHERYAADIVTSLNKALDRYAGHYERVRLIGHSGGGTLAMLMAAKRHDVDAVITLAGNLDVPRWAQFHDYSPLIGSLNPIDFPLPPSVKQLHYAAENDGHVPAWLIKQSAEKLGSSARVIPGIDHRCCWGSHWQEILASIEQK